MGKKYFTVDEVNELIPQLDHHFRKMLLHKKEMSKATVRLRKLGVEPQLLEAAPPSGSPDVQELHRQLQNHYFSFKQNLLAIERTGGEIKDLELGRVDFPSLEDGREGRLTWQLGVTEAAYRHPLPEEGPSLPFEKANIRRVG
ncbi:MAG: DUF2203 family protein [Deltaproteobacteria bacterium]|nr:DUF2203 family protein [Deltaproteobacteria bacterium]